jgi:hypothetical protein
MSQKIHLDLTNQQKGKYVVQTRKCYSIAVYHISTTVDILLIEHTHKQEESIGGVSSVLTITSYVNIPERREREEASTRTIERGTAGCSLLLLATT